MINDALRFGASLLEGDTGLHAGKDSGGVVEEIVLTTFEMERHEDDGGIYALRKVNTVWHDSDNGARLT